MTLHFEDLQLDKNGYLADPASWNKQIAELFAEDDELLLTDDHWQVINYVRNFYDEFNKSPSIRPLVKYLAKQLGEEKGNSIFLMMLFPGGPAKQATRIAGLPKPSRCI
ncbi:MAG: sulfurtransferase TusE [Gammaproteobacteria bacterium]|nr:MAG: sulfurtransferase TusE [Gammaproteobacteria bacterium]